MSEHIVRVPLQRGADNDDYILIHVKPINVDTLELALTSTDNQALFSAKMNHDRIATSQADQSGDRSQWEAVLRWVLLRPVPERRYNHVIDTLDLQAVIENNRKMVVTIRQDICGITQRLGSLEFMEFQATPEVEADILFQWGGIQADNTLQLTKENMRIVERTVSQQLTIDKLKGQMEDFIKKQKEREDDMLEQFRHLLNTKKLKIRDQQRLLAGAKVDPKAAKAIKDAREISSKPLPQASRKRKGTSTADGNDDGPRIKEERISDAETDDETTPQISDQSEDDEDAAFQTYIPSRERQSIPNLTSASSTALQTPAQAAAVNNQNSAQDDKRNDTDHGNDDDDDDDDDDETDDEL